MNAINILSSKSKLIKITGACIAVVALGVFFIFNPDIIALDFLGFEINNTFLGYTLTLVFGIFNILLFRQLLSHGAGLIIDEGGITDSSSYTAIGFISWKDIEEITTINLKGQNLILIKVINPNDYLNNIPSGIKRNVILLNVKSTGTPIAISATSLKTTHEELLALLKDNFSKHGKK